MNKQELETKRDIWWKLQQQSLSRSIDVSDADKRSFLGTVSNALYAELRDKDSRQQQAVTWGVTILAGGGLLSATLKDVQQLSLVTVLPLATILGLLTWVLDRIILSLAEDRMSIARQLDRVHEVLGVFDEGYYYGESSLFDPIWRGWGFDTKRDANYQHSQKFRVVIWIAYAFVILLLAGAIAVRHIRA
jgi:hypothetical protein